MLQPSLANYEDQLVFHKRMKKFENTSEPELI